MNWLLIKFLLNTYHTQLYESNFWSFGVYLIVGDGEVDAEQEVLDDPNFYAWNELRLHPLLMRAIHHLGFKEPMPIQKQCIPAAAHQGKVGLVCVMAPCSVKLFKMHLPEHHNFTYIRM